VIWLMSTRYLFGGIPDRMTDRDGPANITAHIDRADGNAIIRLNLFCFDIVFLAHKMFDPAGILILVVVIMVVVPDHDVSTGIPAYIKTADPDAPVCGRTFCPGSAALLRFPSLI
jgi:hypothetical protein